MLGLEERGKRGRWRRGAEVKRRKEEARGRRDEGEERGREGERERGQRRKKNVKKRGVVQAGKKLTNWHV